MENNKKKRSVLLLIAAIIGIAYAIYSVSYWGGANTGATDSMEAVGAGIATVLVMPHLVCTGLAIIFNVLAWFMSHRGFALTAAILYTVALVLFPVYFMFVILEAIFCYVGFARLKKLNGDK